ncbi:IPPK family protein [Megaselia abdita]
MDFSQIELIYRAEGNANLVVAIPQYKKVLRLPKANISTKSSSSTATSSSRSLSCDLKGLANTRIPSSEQQEDILNPADNLAYTKLLGTLIGSEYIYVPDSVAIISQTDSEKISSICRPFRPAHRRDKKICGQFGYILPDATLLPDNLCANIQLLPTTNTFAIEIKPKQGWKLTETVNSNLIDLRNSGKCRYCAMQFSKLKNCKISALSSYCPLDLFSGIQSRMETAIHALLRCPQNNLRIFENGNLIYGDHSGSLLFTDLQGRGSLFEKNFKTMVEIVRKALLTNYIHSEETTSFDERSCVLETILKIQQLAEENFAFMSKRSYEDCKSYQVVRNILRKNITTLDDLLPEERYSLSATLMDCSIIITFHEMALEKKEDDFKNSHFIKTEDGSTFLTKVTIVDLDAKPDNHFRKYVNTTNEAYASIS